MHKFFIGPRLTNQKHSYARNGLVQTIGVCLCTYDLVQPISNIPMKETASSKQSEYAYAHMTLFNQSVTFLWKKWPHPNNQSMPMHIWSCSTNQMHSYGRNGIIQTIGLCLCTHDLVQPIRYIPMQEMASSKQSEYAYAHMILFNQSDTFLWKKWPHPNNRTMPMHTWPCSTNQIHSYARNSLVQTIGVCLCTYDLVQPVRYIPMQEMASSKQSEYAYANMASSNQSRSMVTLNNVEKPFTNKAQFFHNPCYKKYKKLAHDIIKYRKNDFTLIMMTI